MTNEDVRAVIEELGLEVNYVKKTTEEHIFRNDTKRHETYNFSVAFGDRPGYVILNDDYSLTLKVGYSISKPIDLNDLRNQLLSKMQNKKSLIIAVDFDGTIVSHQYPDIGQDLGAVPYLKRLQEAGHRLVLETMRDGEELDAALDWLQEQDVRVETLLEAHEKQNWTSSSKLHAHLYIDDRGACVPLQWLDGEKRPCMDWEEMGVWLAEHGFFD